METSESEIAAAPPANRLIAPLWHTLLLVAFLLIFSYLGSEGHHDLGHAQRLGLYVETMVMEWLMIGFIVWGLRLARRTTLRELVGGRWNKPEDFLLDVAVAAGFWLVAALVLAAMAYALGMVNEAAVKDIQQRIGSMVPDGPLELAVWIALSTTAGFCEEVIFRGYFQQQFAALLNFAWGGIIVQGLIFGGSHAYEGWQQMVRIGVFGILFGMLAHWRRSLRPGMMAHAAQDIIAGGLARFALKHVDKAFPR